MSTSTDTVRPYSIPSGAVRIVLAVAATVVALAVTAGTVDGFRESRPTTDRSVAPTDATDMTDMPVPEWLQGYLARGDGSTGSPRVAVTTPVNAGLR